MAFIRLRNLFCNSIGQSTVEYILLIAVVAGLALTVFSSQPFQDLLGEEGTFGNAVKLELEYSYRHALPGRVPFRRPNYNSDTHDSMRSGRFFIAADPYPNQ